MINSITLIKEERQMRKELLFAFMAIFLMSLTAITGVYAIENDMKIVTLIEMQEDITGDGMKDNIILTGLPFSKDDIGYKKLYITFKLSNGKTYKEKLTYGLRPHLDVVDINHDRVKDVIVQVPTDEVDGLGKQYIFSIQKNQVTKIPVPNLKIQGEFLNDYKAKVSIVSLKETFMFDLSVKKEMYESLGMYQNGKLNEPTELVILPFSHLYPLETKDAKFGIKGIQLVSGTSETDTIAYVETSWFYRDGDWKLINTNIEAAKNE
jgi:hypothetical protein